MYAEMAQHDDLTYSLKDYATETKKFVGWIESHRLSSGQRLLDVTCGTGQHLGFFSGMIDTYMGVRPNG